MAKIGYARVSTAGQNDDSQVDELKAYGCDRIFIDHGVSGKLAARPELDKCAGLPPRGRRPGDHAHVPGDAQPQAHDRARRGAAAAGGSG